MSSRPGYIESLVVGALPDEELQLLRRGAVLRYITRDLAEVVTESPQAAQRLVEHPLVQGDELWTIADPLRKALLAGWDGADAIRVRVAESPAGLDSLYARLSGARTRTAALAELEREFAAALTDADVPRAHDLVRLLDEWPVAEVTEARLLRDRLAPRLRRHSRGLRDREATARYLERDFEAELRSMLRTDRRRWLIQLHGPGGRGKTVLLKNLLSRWCPRHDIPVARIDFDHVAQLGIATAEPWRLLLALAAQLDPQLPRSPFGRLLASYDLVPAVTQPEALPRVAPGAVAAPAAGRDELDVYAAREVPRAFRGELAAAVGAGPVVIALDTVENVLHAEGADLGPLLAELAATRREGVPGLRVILSGRYDLTGDRPAPGGGRRPRVPGFRERFAGAPEETERARWGTTEVRLAREVATLEIPGFTPEEARRFLAERGGLTDPAIVAAIVARTHDNPMKLDLLAEYVHRNPEVTAETIASFARIDLFYLVDRVVDRIADGRVQWLLRWGALLPHVTREAVEQVIWPALDAFAAFRSSYDDPTRDGLPEARPEVSRWEIPALPSVREAGALETAWDRMLDYAAHSSWVSAVDGLDDAVAFHPEVREPLRRLLREGGHPAYDDIHRRAYAYWAGAAGSARGAARTAALRALLFHAFQPWDGAEHDGDRLFVDLLGRLGEDREGRGALARDVLDLQAPSADSRALAHLELAEAVVAAAGQRAAPVDESALSYHLGLVGDRLRGREPKRTAFLEGVLLEATGRLDEGWSLVGRTLAGEALGALLGLIAGWAGARTPPVTALGVAHRLADQARETTFAPPSYRALTRVLLAAERWDEALAAAAGARSAELRCAAYVAVCDVDPVLRHAANPGRWRARARLLRFEPSAALDELDGVTGPDALLIRAEAYEQLDRPEDALEALSQAAAHRDTATAVAGSLELARLQARLERAQSSSSHLHRLTGFTDPVVAARAMLLEARLRRAAGGGSLERAERFVAAAPGLPPSTLVDLAVARLCVHGVTDQWLAGLRDALAAVQGAGARLLALRGLADVPPPGAVAAAFLRDDLRALAGLEGTPAVPAAVLGRVELERVLGDRDAVVTLLLGLMATPRDPDGALTRAVGEAQRRLGPQTKGIPAHPGDRISSRPGDRISSRPGDRISGPPGYGDSGPPGYGTEAVPGGGRDAVVLTFGITELPGEALHIETRRGAAVSSSYQARPGDEVRRLAGSPASFLAELGSELRLDVPTRPEEIELRFSDPEPARWPWELATVGGVPLSSFTGSGLLRAHGPYRPGRRELVASPGALLVDNRAREYLGRTLDRLETQYHGLATALSGRDATLERVMDGLRGETHRIVHLAAHPTHRRGMPALYLGDELLTAESLGSALSGGPRLLILDLDLSASDHEAAEGLMHANGFCWHLVRNAPDVSVVCGTFSDGGHEPRLRELTTSLYEGRPLGEIAALLQRPHPAPDGRHPMRDVVSLSTDSPRRRFLLGAPL